MGVGSFCLVLHGHLPYVLRHGIWPHGEDWLYEAAAETYLPILAVIDECAFLNAPARITVGLTPVLLEQLSSEVFKDGLDHYLTDRIDRARQDHRDFVGMGNAHLAYLADRWVEIFERLAQQFHAIKRDIAGAYAERARRGLVEILTSAATHAYLPLLYEDSSIRAQLRAGLASSHRILGFKPTGMWLPECAYRGGGQWNPPIAWGGKDNRIALEYLVGDETINHFFLERHLIEGSRSEWVRNEGWHRVGWDESAKYPARGWRSVNEPALVGSDGFGPGPVAAFGRDAQVCEQVWSGSIGYPADGSYLEFHKRHGARRGLRYWKVTNAKSGLGEKEMYYPDDVTPKVFAHAQHFCNVIRQRLWDYRKATGRYGVVVASFDAELFGHWWFEGPQFLRDVILTLNADPDVDLSTSEEFLKNNPPDKTVSLPEGSWGDGGDHRVWTNEKVNWMWDIEYRCEANFGKMTFELPWQKDKQIEELLKKAARELLLLQASDWQFVVTRGQAIDYGIKRFMLHVSRFETLIDLCEKLGHDSTYLGRLNLVERHEVDDADLHDIIFPHIELDWWKM
ncbi:MAG: 1,4-alpha-glucan branching protein domain-containing protein [Phycisphaerae bacterium]